MKFNSVKIEDLVEIIDGDRGKNYPQQHEFSDTGYCLFLNASNVTADGFSFEQNSFISQEKDEALRKGRLCRNDIVYTTRGTVGNAAYYKENVPFEHIRINSGMVIMRTKPSADVRFLYQLLKNDETRKYILSFCTGSAQPQLPIKNLGKIELSIPPIDEQRRIGNIISAYDDLIENNCRQIKLLEEAARRLYREWFVDFRFPGHEQVKIVDGVPEGWKKAKLSEIMEIRYGKDHKSIPDGDIPVYGSGGLMRYCAKSMYEGESVLIPRKGTLNNILYVDKPFWTVDTMFYSIMKVPNIAIYMHQYLSTLDFYSMNTGAAVPSTTAETLNNLLAISPNKLLLTKYDCFAKKFYQRMDIIKKQCKELVKARDMILRETMDNEKE